jgi:DUF1680 family protein
MQKLSSLPLKAVQIKGGFWGSRVDNNRKKTIPHVYDELLENGRISAIELNWKEGQPNKPHLFFDSDVAKWIEAVSYSLIHFPDAHLEKQVDDYVDALGRAQTPDGYVNSYFLSLEPQTRWTTLRDRHELYCAGHLIEAAVAYAQATGKNKFLDIMQRYVDHIAQVFGPGENQRHGYPGHQEIELALVKLYRATGKEKYLALAKYFIDERGKQPYYFDQEAQQRGEDPKQYHFYDQGNYAYCQADKPVREQDVVVGHSVRAMYMYSGMADVGMASEDESLIAACRKLWSSLTERRMYITAGIGSAGSNEGFTLDYDLPNKTAYAETCAAIALVFWAHRMLLADPNRKYADVMERALYNGILSGVSLDGKTFFYANPLARFPKERLVKHDSETEERQPWFRCACCPPNLARLFADLGEYIYSAGDDALFVHLYIQNQAELTLNGQAVQVELKTDYPWKEDVELTFNPTRPTHFTLALRIPDWCSGASLAINGQPVSFPKDLQDGYLKIEREWAPNDQVTLRLPMPVTQIEANPKVREDNGRYALQRGPLIYCLEEADNGPELDAIHLSAEPALTAAYSPDTLGGCVIIQGKAYRRPAAGWDKLLYRPKGPSAEKPVTVTAVPYAFWSNRGLGEMEIWVRGG